MAADTSGSESPERPHPPCWPHPPSGVWLAAARHTFAVSASASPARPSVGVAASLAFQGVAVVEVGGSLDAASAPVRAAPSGAGVAGRARGGSRSVVSTGKVLRVWSVSWRLGGGAGAPAPRWPWSRGINGGRYLAAPCRALLQPSAPVAAGEGGTRRYAGGRRLRPQLAPRCRKGEW